MLDFRIGLRKLQQPRRKTLGRLPPQEGPQIARRQVIAGRFRGCSGPDQAARDDHSRHQMLAEAIVLEGETFAVAFKVAVCEFEANRIILRARDGRGHGLHIAALDLDTVLGRICLPAFEAALARQRNEPAVAQIEQRLWALRILAWH